MLIGSEFQINSGIHTAKTAQVHTATSTTSQKSQSFVQIHQKKTPTNKASSHLHQIVLQERENTGRGENSMEQRGVMGSRAQVAHRGHGQAVDNILHQKYRVGSGKDCSVGIGGSTLNAQVPLRDKSAGQQQALDNVSQSQNIQSSRQKRSNQSESSKHNNVFNNNDRYIQNGPNIGASNVNQILPQANAHQQIVQMQNQLPQSSKPSQIQLQSQNKRQISQESQISQISHKSKISHQNKREIYGSLSSQAQLAAVAQQKSDHLQQQQYQYTQESNIQRPTQSRSQGPNKNSGGAQQQQKILDQMAFDHKVNSNQIQAQNQMHNHHNIQNNYDRQGFLNTSTKQIINHGINTNQNQEMVSKSVQAKANNNIVAQQSQGHEVSGGISIGVTRVTNKARNADRLLLKSREGTIIGKPRNDSGNSAGQGLVGPAKGNVTATSACNQSFQFGYSQNFGQALVTAHSGGRGGSSGSNPRTKTRYRSGSNKNIKSKSKDANKSNQLVQKSTNQKNLKNPKITINTNKAQLIEGVQKLTHDLGVSTTKTMQGNRQGKYQTHHISSVKNRDNVFIEIDTKNAITPASGNSKNIGLIQGNVVNQQINTCSAINNNQKMKFDQKTIKAKLMSKNEKIAMGGGQHMGNAKNILNFSNLNYIHPKEPATTKNLEQNAGIIGSTNKLDFYANNANATLNQKRQPQNFQILDQKQTACFPASNKHEANKDKLIGGGYKSQLKEASAFKNSSKIDKNIKNSGHSNILNKLGKSNPFSKSSFKKTQNKNQEKNAVNSSSNQDDDDVSTQLQAAPRSRAMVILNTQSSMDQQANQVTSHPIPATSTQDKQSIVKPHQNKHHMAQKDLPINDIAKTITAQSAQAMHGHSQQQAPTSSSMIDRHDRHQGVCYQTIGSSEKNHDNHLNFEGCQDGVKSFVINKTNNNIDSLNKIAAQNKGLGPNHLMKQMLQDQQNMDYHNQLSAMAASDAQIASFQKNNKLTHLQKSTEMIQTVQLVQTSQNRPAREQQDIKKGQKLQKQKQKINVNLKNQTIMQKSFEKEFTNSKAMLIAQEENVNASGDQWDQQSRASQRSKYSKHSKHSRHSRQSRQSKQSKNSRQSKKQKPTGFQAQFANRIAQGNLREQTAITSLEKKGYNINITSQNQQIEVYHMQMQSKQGNLYSNQVELSAPQERQAAQIVAHSTQNAQGQFQQNDAKSIYSNKQSQNSKQSNYQASYSINSSQSQKHSQQKLQKTSEMIQNNQNSLPNLPPSLHDDRQNTQEESLKSLQQMQVQQQLAEKHQQVFYQQELKKRDNIVLFLCEKMQNMESQIEQLRTHQNKSCIQNLKNLGDNGVSDIPDNSGSVSMQLVPNSVTPDTGDKIVGRGNGSQLQSNLNQVNSQKSNIQLMGILSDIQQSNQDNNMKIGNKKVVDFDPSNLSNPLNHNIPLVSNKYENPNPPSSKLNSQIELMNLKLNETSDNEEMNEQYYHQNIQNSGQVAAHIGDDMEASENYQDNNYEQTAGFMQHDDEEEEQVEHINSQINKERVGGQKLMKQEHATLRQTLATEFSRDNQRDNRGEKSQQRIEQVFIQMQEKLDKFKRFNNPKKIADLRKYCATSITQNSKNNTGRISSRLQDSGGNSGGTGRYLNGRDGAGNSGSNTNKTNTNGTNTLYQRTSNRHYQSTSDVDINSLVTVGEDFCRFTRKSNRVSEKQEKKSDKLTHIIDNTDQDENSPFVHSEAALALGQLQNKANNSRQVNHPQVSSNTMNQKNFMIKLNLDNNEAFSRRVESIQFNCKNNDSFFPELPEKADINDILAHGGVNDDTDAMIVKQQIQNDKLNNDDSAIDNTNSNPLLISAVSVVQEEDEEEIGGTAEGQIENIENIEIIEEHDDCHQFENVQAAFQASQNSSLDDNRDHVVRRASIMNYAIVSQDTSQEIANDNLQEFTGQRVRQGKNHNAKIQMTALPIEEMSQQSSFSQAFDPLAQVEENKAHNDQIKIIELNSMDPMNIGLAVQGGGQAIYEGILVNSGIDKPSIHIYQKLNEFQNGRDISELDKIGNIGSLAPNDEDGKTEKDDAQDNALKDLERQWRLQQLENNSDYSIEDQIKQRPTKQKRDKKLITNVSDKNNDEFKFIPKKQFVKTQKIMINSKIMNDALENSMENKINNQKKIQQSFEINQDEDESCVENQMIIGKVTGSSNEIQQLQFYETQQIGKASENFLKSQLGLAGNQGDRSSTKIENNCEGLSKTLSKETLALKFKKANLVNLDGSNINKNAIVKNNQAKDQANEVQQRKHKIKLINNSENMRKQNINSESRYEAGVSAATHAVSNQNQARIPKLKLIGDRSQNKRQKQIQINNYFQSVPQSQIQQTNIANQAQNIYHQLSDSQNEKVHSMERQLQQLDELERNEPQLNLIQIQQQYAQMMLMTESLKQLQSQRQADSSQENQSIQEDSRLSNDQSRGGFRLQIGRSHPGATQGSVQAQLQGQGQEFINEGLSSSQTQNTSNHPNFFDDQNNAISIQHTNVSNQQNQAIYDTTFQPINMSSNSSLQISSQLQNHQNSQNQDQSSSYLAQNSISENQVNQSHNFAANVAHFQHQVSQTPNKRLIKKKKTITAGAAASVVAGPGTTGQSNANTIVTNQDIKATIQLDNQAASHQQVQALLNIQNKAQVIFQSQNNNRGGSSIHQNQNSSIDRNEMLKKMLKLQQKRAKGAQADTTNSATTTSLSVVSSAMSQQQKHLKITNSIQNSRQNILLTENSQRPQGQVKANNNKSLDSRQQADNSNAKKHASRSPPKHDLPDSALTQITGANQPSNPTYPILMKLNLQDVISKQQEESQMDEDKF